MLTRAQLAERLGDLWATRFKRKRSHLAKELEMSNTNIGIIVKALPALPALEPDTCILLADLLEESPSAVLRACDHERLAELIETHYGSPHLRKAPPPLSAEERHCLELWRSLAPSRREALEEIAEAWVSKKTQAR